MGHAGRSGLLLDPPNTLVSILELGSISPRAIYTGLSVQSGLGSKLGFGGWGNREVTPISGEVADTVQAVDSR
jgi:hypothetical protein